MQVSLGGTVEERLHVSQSLRSLRFLLNYQREQMAGPRSAAQKRAQKTKSAMPSRLVRPNP